MRCALQERARFRRLYPPLKGSTHDPRYHWRGEKDESSQMDRILGRLVDIRVRPVEQAAKCACTVESPSGRSARLPHSANNAVDTMLPYNPWYGSYTEHLLQTLTIDDADDHVERIRPVIIAAAKLQVHIDGDRNNEDGLDRPETAAESEQSADELAEPDTGVHSASTDPRDESDESAATLEASEPAEPVVHEPAATSESGSPTAGRRRSRPEITPRRRSTIVRDGGFVVTAQTPKSVSVAGISPETSKKSSVVTVDGEKSVATAPQANTPPEYKSEKKDSLVVEQQIEEQRLVATRDPANPKISRNHSVSLRNQGQRHNISITPQRPLAKQTMPAGSIDKLSLNDLIDSMLNMPSVGHHQKASAVQSMMKKVQGEKGGAETTGTSAEETSKAVPDMSEDHGGLIRRSAGENDSTAAVPDVSEGGNSLSRRVVEDREVSSFMAGTELQSEIVGSRPQLADAGAENTDDEMKDSNSEKQSYKQEDITETRQDQERRNDEKNADHPSVLSDSTVKQATAAESFPVALLNGNSADTTEEPGKDPVPQQEPEEPPEQKNVPEIETETTPEAEKPERRSTMVPVRLPRTSAKRVSSKSNLPSDGDRTDIQRPSEELNGELVERVATDNVTADTVPSSRGRASEEDMDVDEEDTVEHGEDEAKADDAEYEGRSEIITDGADWRKSLDAEAKSKVEQQQQQQQQVTDSVEPTTWNESRNTVSITATADDGNSSALRAPGVPDPTHDTRQDVGEFPAPGSTTMNSLPVDHPPSHDLSSNAHQTIQEGTTVASEEPTAKSQQQSESPAENDSAAAEPHSKFSKSATGHKELKHEDDADQQTRERTTVPHREATAQNLTQKHQLKLPTEDADTTEPESKFHKSATGHRESEQKNQPTRKGNTLTLREPLAQNWSQKHQLLPIESLVEDADTTEPEPKFPKSATGYRESEQRDGRAKRLAKSIRIYHDLSTISTEYQDSGNKAVTTIHLKSTRNR